MTRLIPIPYALGILFVEDPADPVRDERVVRPARRIKESRRARV
ncbi:MAG: hypothetical protein QOF45_1009 [Gaiellaceae bacterium]|jgi:hypothetical protein|nr:hypothetical protein [Gaiellaceae bacterium]